MRNWDVICCPNKPNPKQMHTKMKGPILVCMWMNVYEWIYKLIAETGGTCKAWGWPTLQDSMGCDIPSGGRGFVSPQFIQLQRLMLRWEAVPLGQRNGLWAQSWPWHGTKESAPKKASLAGHEVRLEGEFSCWGLCWGRWLPSDSPISNYLCQQALIWIRSPKAPVPKSPDFRSEWVFSLNKAYSKSLSHIFGYSLCCWGWRPPFLTGQREVSRRHLRSFQEQGFELLKPVHVRIEVSSSSWGKHSGLC